MCAGSEVEGGPVTSLQKRKSVFAQLCICGCRGDGRNVDKDDGKEDKQKRGVRKCQKTGGTFRPLGAAEVN